MSAEHNINPQDYELISAYIDGELTDTERASLEQRLAKESFLQHELNTLRSTVELIHYLQPMTAPRNFTLTDEMVNSSKVIAFKPRRRVQPSYLSMVASVLLMLFGVIFMLSDIAEPQIFSADTSAPVQSNLSSEKNTAREIASVPTLFSTLVDSQTERTQEEPDTLDAIVMEEAEAPPPEASTVLNQQAPPANESLADAEFRLESFDGDNVADDGFFDVGAASAIESPVSASSDVDDDGYAMAGEALLLETIPEEDSIEQDSPQPMTGGTGEGFAEALSDTSTTGNEILDSNDSANEPKDKDQGRDDESTEGIGRIVSATEIPLSPPPLPDSRTRGNSTLNTNNMQIGFGLLMVGILLLITSIIFIRRNRS